MTEQSLCEYDAKLCALQAVSACIDACDALQMTYSKHKRLEYVYSPEGRRADRDNRQKI